ncbi:MAG: hypothetical protein GC165_11125 [Armatimonadetes bacterium]|nr:hypothetical protein [Armatimonadota bacterium]MBS1728326.1 hypothetical protein [Armatimonadota bacterium]
MNWRLLVYLSLFAFVMAIATISFIPQMYEVILWVFIFGFCSYFIAKHATGQFFFHGFMLGIISCIYLVTFRFAFFDAYSATHGDLLSAYPQGISPRTVTAALAVIEGTFGGVLLGLLTFGVAKMQKKA